MESEAKPPCCPKSAEAVKNFVKDQLKNLLPELARKAVEFHVKALAESVGAGMLVELMNEHPEQRGKALLFLAFVRAGADPNRAMEIVMGADADPASGQIVGSM